MPAFVGARKIVSANRQPILENMAAWFRFGQGITSSATLVSQWDDASGNGRHLKQTTDTNKPALQSDNSILFDGSDNYLKCDSFTLNQPETVYVLGKLVSWTANDSLFDGNALNSGRIFMRTATPNQAIKAASSVADNAELAIGSLGVIVAIFNGAASLLQINNGAPATGDAGSNNMGGFTLGARGDVGSAFGNVQVHEVILYSVAHGAAQRAQNVRYLGRLGGLVL